MSLNSPNLAACSIQAVPPQYSDELKAKPLFYFNTQKLSKIRKNAPLQSRFILDVQSISICSKNRALQKTLKHAKKITLNPEAATKLPSPVRTCIQHCKNITFLPSRSLVSKGIKKLAKFISKSGSAHLKTFNLKTACSASESDSLRPLFHSIIARRDLQVLNININLYLNLKNLHFLERCLQRLRNLNTFGFTLSYAVLQNLDPIFYERLGNAFSSIQNLESFSLQCYVTEDNYQNMNNVMEKISKIKQIESTSLILQTIDQLPPVFYSTISRSLKNLINLKYLSLRIESRANQILGFGFFNPLSELKNLESLDLILPQLKNGFSEETQELLKTVKELHQLSSFQLASLNGKTIHISNEYFKELSKSLSSSRNLKELTLDIQSLRLTNFTALFENTSHHFENLTKLKLNISLNETDINGLSQLSVFLRNKSKIQSLSLKINNNDTSIYTYQVPLEAFEILYRGLNQLQYLQDLELDLGIIQDSTLETILKILDHLSLRNFYLAASFQNITYQAFEKLYFYLCNLPKTDLKLQIIPKHYPFEMCELIESILGYINA